MQITKIIIILHEHITLLLQLVLFKYIEPMNYISDSSTAENYWHDHDHHADDHHDYHCDDHHDDHHDDHQHGDQHDKVDHSFL